MPFEKPRLLSFQICTALASQNRPVHSNITHHHFQTVFQSITDNLSRFYVLLLHEGNSVWQSPGVALACDRSQLIGNGQTFFVGGNNGGKQFAGKFMPEMIQEVLHRAAYASVVVRRPKENDVSLF